MKSLRNAKRLIYVTVGCNFKKKQQLDLDYLPKSGNFE